MHVKQLHLESEEEFLEFNLINFIKIQLILLKMLFLKKIKKEIKFHLSLKQII